MCTSAKVLNPCWHSAQMFPSASCYLKLRPKRCAPPQGTLQRLSKKLGVDLRVARFVRLQCGEGLDNQKADFAAEVAAMTS